MDSQLTPARIAAVAAGSLTLLGLEPDDPFRPEVVQAPPDLGPLVVGDWVACERHADRWIVTELLPRSSSFMRKAAGKSSAAQLVAANVDRVLIVTAIGADLSPRRIERYLSAIWAGGAEPVIVVNKIDRAHDAEALARELDVVASGAPVVRISALHEQGLAELEPYLVPGSTVAIVGSSGVGKTTLVNRLLGEARLATHEVREHDDTGQHTTTRRELIRVPSGVLLIDTPGMRELGLVDAASGLEVAFADVARRAEQCRFRDCRHQTEPGCAVRRAIEAGELSEARVSSYSRLHEELEIHTQRSQEQAARDTKSRWRAVHKNIRERQKLHQRLGLKDD